MTHHDHQCFDPNDEEMSECERPNLCDGDTDNNYWVEGGVCILNHLEEDQVVYAIERNDLARKDLLRVTTNEYLHELAARVPRLPTTSEEESLQKMNHGILPFYTVFNGNFNDH